MRITLSLALVFVVQLTCAGELLAGTEIIRGKVVEMDGALLLERVDRSYRLDGLDDEQSEVLRSIVGYEASVEGVATVFGIGAEEWGTVEVVQLVAPVRTERRYQISGFGEGWVARPADEAYYLQVRGRIELLGLARDRLVVLAGYVVSRGINEALVVVGMKVRPKSWTKSRANIQGAPQLTAAKPGLITAVRSYWAVRVHEDEVLLTNSNRATVKGYVPRDDLRYGGSPSFRATIFEYAAAIEQRRRLQEVLAAELDRFGNSVNKLDEAVTELKESMASRRGLIGTLER